MLPDTFWALEEQAFFRMVNRLAEARVTLSVQANTVPADGVAKKASDAGMPLKVVGGVAVVSIQGTMLRRMSWMSSLLGGTSMLAVKAALAAAVSDKSVRSILLRIDSLGGPVLGLSDLADFIAWAGGQKSLVAHIDGVGASAGYYAASQASKVYAGRTDMTGSIGTIMVLYDYSEAAKKEGVKPVVLSTGKFKGAGVMGTKITDEQIAEFQKIVDFYGDDFQAAVARGRGMSREQVAKVADGRVFVAPEALSLGLIDGIQPFEATLQSLMSAGHDGARDGGTGGSARSTRLADARIAVARRR